MSTQEPVEMPAVFTPRLVFDKDEDMEVPRFLRGEVLKPEEVKEPEMREKIDQQELPSSLTDLVDNIPETINPIEAPAEVNELDTAEIHGETMDPATDPNTPPTNLDELSVEELKQQQEEIDRKIKQKQEAEKKAVIDQIVEVVNTYKIPVEELVEALGGMKVKRKGVKAVQKYQDPATGVTWSGRGKEPAWIKGKDRKKFLIPE